MHPREPGDPLVVGRYTILARIGAGGMAVIYFGRAGTGRAAAIKVMHTEFAHKPDYRERFRREITLTRAAGGRYSPGVLDADPDAERPWLATEFVPSVSLRDAVVAHGPFPDASVWGLAAGLVEALATIHAAGIVHRDLKPANVLLTGDGLRVIDFGIAGPPTAEGTTPAGSPGFMSPEQRAGAPTGPASDVYSLGATLAFAADTEDDSLRGLIADCQRPDPEDRPGVPELKARLSPVAEWPPAVIAEIHRRTAEAANPPVPVDRPSVSRRWVMAGLSGLFVAGAAGAVWAFSRPKPESPTPPPKAPEPSTPTSTSVTKQPATRELEFYVFGDTRVKSLTTKVNDQAVTVTDPQLPYSRKVTIPAWPTRTTYALSYTFTKGNFSWRVLVDGSEYGSGGGSSANPDVTDSFDDGLI